MTVGEPFRELGRFLDECEGSERAVTGVELAGDGQAGDSGLSVTVELSISPPQADGGTGGPALRSPRLGPDGTLRFAVDAAGPLVPTADCDVDVELLDASVDRAGAITARIRATPTHEGLQGECDSPHSVGLERGAAVGDDGRAGAGTDSLAAEGEADLDGDRDVPPFKDPELLADVYESCETFAEMAEAIDMDVTAETVRRYMIDYDIHHPNTYRTAEGDDAESGEPGGAEDRSETVETDRTGADESTGDDDGQVAVDDAGGRAPGSAGAADAGATEPVVLSDGIGLPDDVTVDTLIDTVKRSNTIYEVTREVNVDRQDALEVLKELNLLDLVVGRLATEGERDLSREEIVDRLRDAPGTQ